MHTDYRGGELYCEVVPLARLATEFGTPLYVYSAGRIQSNFARLAQAFQLPGANPSVSIHYSVKANSNASLLRLLRDLGAGFDVVSGGELFRVLRAGAQPAMVVFAGVGKTEAEIEQGLRAGIGWFNVESVDELDTLNAAAGRLGKTAVVALRLNPGVEPDTHHHIRTSGAESKFGLPVDEALKLCREHPRFAHVQIRGLHIHIGSQLPGPGPVIQALGTAHEVMHGARAAGAPMDALDLGGGFPVAYREGERAPAFADFAGPINDWLLRHSPPIAHVMLEPGRSIVADAGVLLTSVQAVKQASGRQLAIVDAGMNTLLRPALYDAYHRVLPITASDVRRLPTDVAGPICESADFLARARSLPPLRRGDQLAILDAGAYGFSMASHYNSHPLPAEVLVEGESYRVIRRRETYGDLVKNEGEN